MQRGTVIQERYELEHPLGHGGMAEVWCARDQRLARSVAIKFLAPKLAEDPEFLVRFFSEAQAVARISDPHVVGVLDFGQHEGEPFLVMEYVPGGTLSELVGQPIVPERVCEIIADAARGVAAAHAQGLIHRDIKPGNILLDDEGHAKIADFGIAAATGTENLTATGAAIGSPHYISPEHVSAKEVTPRSDVYSFGIVLFELLTGCRPFGGDNVTAIAIAQVETDPPVPGSINPDVPEALDALVLKCLAKDPEARFQSADELARALEQHSVPVPIGATGVMSAETLSEETPSGRPRVLAGTVVILMLLGLASAGVFASARRQAPPPATAPDDGSAQEAPPAPVPTPTPTFSAAAVPASRPGAPAPQDEPKEEEEEEKEESTKPTPKPKPSDPEPEDEPEEEAPSPPPSPASSPSPDPESSPTS
jgi:serine/threonine-protein kinase